jgi:hypothetical protein
VERFPAVVERSPDRSTSLDQPWIVDILNSNRRRTDGESIMSLTPPAPGGPTPEELKAAFKAFKKRLKLTRLDEESRLSKSPLSKGASGIVAVSPPNQYPQAVWDELVRQGKLKKMDGGTYGLAER